MARHDERGQVLIIVALALVVLLGASAFTIDLGRRAAEERFLQNAADAAALAACNALINGASDSDALQEARAVAATNLTSSPAGSDATIAAAGSEEYLAAYPGNPSQMTNGAVIDGEAVRVAIGSDINTTVGRVLGRETLPALGRARCTLEAQPALPIVARRYDAPPGPGGGFSDVLATSTTHTNGTVDPNPLGYSGRTPASLDDKGPLFEIYGNDSKAHNSSEFRGFIVLDIRDFRDATLRDYYNGVVEGTAENTLKAEQAEYVLTGYPGPDFPAATNPPTGDLQVATLSGHNTGHLVDAFRDVYGPGDRILLGVYDGTVNAIPDFAITPPPEIVLPSSTGATPVDGPTFKVSKNAAFTGLVSLELIGDVNSPDPSDNILPTGGTGAPGAGAMNEPVFNPNNFTPSGGSGTSVLMEDISTDAIDPGIYSVWVKGTSNFPIKSRRHPIAVRIGGANRSFNLNNSALSGSASALGEAITFEIRVRGESWATGAPATQASLNWDSSSLSDCLLNPVTPPGGMTVGFSPTSVTPAGGQGALSTLTVDTDGLASGCYMFTVRAHATNSDNQPVTRLATVTFYVAAQPSDGSYVDIIGFAMFEVEAVAGNTISGRAISPICADPTCGDLRRVQRARLIPW